ncbi:MAG: M1 family aminopeptidase, partial [Deltaproteobacteria bacterium]
EVGSIEVDGHSAAFRQLDGELTITPRRGLREQERFVVVIDYGGVPQTLSDPLLGSSGFMHTDDGALVMGEPRVAATWFPANDHPTDRASFTFQISVPDGLEVVANGALVSQRSSAGWTQWVWNATAPMAPYLAGMAIGELAINAYRKNHIRYWDAVDAELFEPLAAPSTGTQFAVSHQANASYKRLSRVISVPAAGAQLAFDVTRDTESGWDFFFVEAHTVGADDWTTLPDAGGIAQKDTGSVCPFWHSIHPFLQHYQSAPSDSDPCAATGSSGEWWAATGASDGVERWTVDLSRWAGSDIEVALSYASDDVVQRNGVIIDDIVASTGAGNTSFEADGDVLDGWLVSGAPEGSPGNENDWSAGTVADLPTPLGELASQSLARQPEIVTFLEDQFGPYPFDIAGAILTSENTGFALENQTRPIYPAVAFSNPISGASILVHELAHQWFGDSLALEAWQHVWLNEGFATYAEWLWSEHEGLETAQQLFDSSLQLDAADPFWSLPIGDPGPDHLFDSAVYQRGAMTLHALRQTVGDDAFFEILQHWTCVEAGQTVTTDDFIAVAEAIANQDLSELFELWLFRPAKP